MDGSGGWLRAGLRALRGEISAFTSDIEKAKAQATDRAREKAKRMGANAIVGMDLETSDIGQTNITLISPTRTAVTVEPE